MASFGARDAFLSQSAWADFGAGLGIAETMGALIPWIQVPTWGHDLWSDAIQRYYGFFGSALVSALVAEASGLGQAEWDARNWQANTWANRKFYGRRTPPWTIFDVGIAKSEGVASEPSAPDGLWGELNANWSRPFYEILPEPDLWSAADWSGEQREPKRIYILEQIAELKSEPLPALDPASPKPLSGTSCAEFAVAGPVPTWGESEFSALPEAQSPRLAPADLYGFCAAEPTFSSNAWSSKTWAEEAWQHSEGLGRVQPEFSLFYREEYSA